MAAHEAELRQAATHRRDLQDELAAIKLERARAARDAEAAAMHARNLTDEIENLKFAAAKGADREAGLGNDMQEQQERLREVQAEAARLAPFETRCAALGHEIDALKLRVRPSLPCRQVVDRQLPSAPCAPTTAPSACNAVVS